MMYNKQRFKQKIGLVELTKILEREHCDTLAFTYRIARYYKTKVLLLSPIVGGDNPSKYESAVKDNLTEWRTPLTAGDTTITQPTMEDAIVFDFSLWPFIVSARSTMTISLSGEVKAEFNSRDPIIYTFTELGTYNIVYNYGITKYVPPNTVYNYDFTLTYNVVVLDMNTPEKPIPTIKEVVERILSVGIPRQENEPQKYTLDPTVADRLDSVLSPELHITRCTLKEALSIAGGVKGIHAIPRLKWNTANNTPTLISFDFLGGGSVWTPPASAKLIGYEKGINPNEYCGGIDSYVDNILNTQDQTEGSIVEPFAGGGISVRSETIAINNDNAITLTSFPIYRLVKLELVAIESQDIDLTSYVFEQAEYDTLSKTSDTYPHSKSFALVYKQGDNKVQGFNVVPNTANTSIAEFGKTTALNKIINAIIETDRDRNYVDLLFRITYIPLSKARVKQLKAFNKYPMDNLLYDNQGSNVVEASYYGANLKGKVGRLGLRNTVYTYRFDDYAHIPKLGQKLNGEYICQISKQLDRYTFKASIYTTPNFNKLSEYIGLNSQFRQFEISELQSIDRDINYSQIMHIGKKQSGYKTNADTTLGFEMLEAIFKQVYAKSDASCAIVQGYTENKTPIPSAVLLPVVSLAFGNSMIFTFQYKDNFNAGQQSVGYDAQQRISQYVPYTDAFGGLYYLYFAIKPTIDIAEPSIDLANALPRIDPSFGDTGDTYLNFWNFERGLVVDKDNRESIRVTAQLHFVSDDESIIIGNALASNCPFVTRVDTKHKAKAVLLPYSLNALDNKVDLSGALVGDFAFTETAITINTDGIKALSVKSLPNTTSKTYQSWAYFDSFDNTLLIGKNMEILPSTQQDTIYINL